MKQNIVLLFELKRRNNDSYVFESIYSMIMIKIQKYQAEELGWITD